MRDAAIDPLRQPGRGSARSQGAPSLDGMLGEGAAPRRATPVARKGPISSAAVAAQRLGAGRSAGRRRSEPGLVTRLGSRFPRIRPLKLLTTSVFSIALVGIVANAMVFQRGRHPAPLFGIGQSVEGDAAPRAAAVPPPALPLERTGSVPAVPAAPPVDAPRPAAAAPAVAAAPKLVPVHRAAKPHHEDGIGGLLGAKAPAPSAHPRPGHAAKPAAPEAKPVAHAEAKPHGAAPATPSPDHRASESRAASEASAILAHPAAPHHVGGDGAAKAHPRPSAAKAPVAAKVQPAAKPEPQKAAKAE